jgi:signal transduction histidine kinase
MTCAGTVASVSQERRPPLIRRMRHRHWVAVDCVAAMVLLIISVTGAAGREPQFGVPVWLATAASAAVAVPVGVRRIWPMAVLGVVLALNTIVIVVGVSGDPAVAVALVLYTVAVSQPRRRSLPAMACALVVTTAAGVVEEQVGKLRLDWQTAVDVIAAGAVVIVATWALGAAIREERRYAARSAAQLARQAVGDERLRIARELHDVVAHSMTLITVKAGVTHYLMDSHPQEARSALRVIEATGRNALTEMRRMLEVLRADSDIAPASGADDADDDRAPIPGLADLEPLATLAAEAGVRAHLQVRGSRDLPEGVALSAYRIVQEALTNVIKHAAPAQCRVLVDITDSDIALEVTDDGPGGRLRPVAAGGHGIIGMRERVNLYGGEFTAGPRPEGGYRVTARLSIPPVDTTQPARQEQVT